MNNGDGTVVLDEWGQTPEEAAAEKEYINNGGRPKWAKPKKFSEEERLERRRRSTREWHRRNYTPEKGKMINQKRKDYARFWAKENKYGITREQFVSMMNSQGGRCAICREYHGERLYVDHNHDTGKVRGLLCNDCNVGIGKFKDSPSFMQLALNYLVSHSERKEKVLCKCETTKGIPA